MSPHSNFHAPRTSLSGRIQIGHKSGCGDYVNYLFILFSVNIKPPRHRFGFSLAWGWQYLCCICKWLSNICTWPSSTDYLQWEYAPVIPIHGTIELIKDVRQFIGGFVNFYQIKIHYFMFYTLLFFFNTK